MKFKRPSIFAAIIAVLSLFSYAAFEVFRLPDKIIVAEGEKNIRGRFFSAQLNVSENGKIKNGVYKSEGKNLGSADIKMFGVLPVKRAEVEVVKPKKVIACGSAIGIRLYADGVYVSGINQLENGISPADAAGLEVGDFITFAGGEKISDTKSLKKVAQKYGGKKMKLKFMRNSKEKETEIIPFRSENTDLWQLGIWAKDSTAGIGTLTFFDSEENTFGALGHGISENGKIIPALKNGSVSEASIIDVKKGKSGLPGELQGVFVGKRAAVGTILKNTKYGIFGKADGKNLVGEEYFTATSDKITEGKAHILSCISGSKPEKYEIEILKVMRYNGNSTKGMVIKITDKRLIEKTGGIVQGMSGSPIIQNNLLIGAVTHVFVNDPTRGYGIFIENMLSEAEKIN